MQLLAGIHLLLDLYLIYFKPIIMVTCVYHTANAATVKQLPDRQQLQSRNSLETTYNEHHHQLQPTYQNPFLTTIPYEKQVMKAFSDDYACHGKFLATVSNVKMKQEDKSPYPCMQNPFLATVPFAKQGNLPAKSVPQVEQLTQVSIDFLNPFFATVPYNELGKRSYETSSIDFSVSTSTEPVNSTESDLRNQAKSDSHDDNDFETATGKCKSDLENWDNDPDTILECQGKVIKKSENELWGSRRTSTSKDVKEVSIPFSLSWRKLEVKEETVPLSPIVVAPPTLPSWKKTMFRRACVSGSALDIVNILRKGDIQVDALLDFDWSGLQHACYNGKLETAEALLQAGADPNYRRYDAMTVLMAVASSPLNEKLGLLACATALLAAGADVNALHAKKLTPLIFAVKRGHVEMVRTFVKVGAKIDQCDYNIRSALHWAAYLGRTHIVRILMENGANLFNTNRFGETPREVAQRSGHVEIADIINIAQNTGFRPGQSPSLLQIRNEENVGKLAKLAVKRQILMLQQHEGEHMKMILEFLNLEHLSDVFAKHRISYFQFLKCKDKDFLEMGIMDPVQRQNLTNQIKATTKSIYTEFNPKPLRMHRKLTFPEVTGILVNNWRQVRRICGSLKGEEDLGMSKLLKKVQENPVQLASDSVSIRDLTLATDAIFDSCKDYKEKLIGVQDELDKRIKTDSSTIKSAYFKNGKDNVDISTIDETSKRNCSISLSSKLFLFTKKTAWFLSIAIGILPASDYVFL